MAHYVELLWNPEDAAGFRPRSRVYPQCPREPDDAVFRDAWSAERPGKSALIRKRRPC